jgi:hypothetical protein
MKRKPKYRVGQVIAVQRSKSKMDYLRITDFEDFEGMRGCLVIAHDSACEWLPLCNVRSLTVGEIGPQRKTKGRTQ